MDKERIMVFIYKIISDLGYKCSYQHNTYDVFNVISVDGADPLGILLGVYVSMEISTSLKPTNNVEVTSENHKILVNISDPDFADKLDTAIHDACVRHCQHQFPDT